MKRIVDKKLCESYRGKPCLLCGKPGVAHHLKTRGSFGPDLEWDLVALCHLHHVMIHQVGLSSMAKKFDRLSYFLRSNEWEYDDFSEKWVHRDKSPYNPL